MDAEQFGPYRVVGHLATGGMAQLHLARQSMAVGSTRPVVLKRILRDRARDEEFVTMFFDEARLLARLRHPNVVSLYDAGEIDGVPFMALEYVQGVTLRDLLAVAARTPDGIVPVDQSVTILLRVAETLSWVHAAQDEHGRPMRIVHRDLTPANVMIGWDGNITLIDFGIAHGENRVYQTTTGVLKGTCGYMAPEQLTEDGEIDARTDVFAFGVMMYETVIGAHPFTAKGVAELYDQLLEARYVLPTEARSDVHLTLAALVVDCMAREASNRPASMRLVAQRLRDHASMQGVRALAWEIGDTVRALCPPGPDGRAQSEGPTTDVRTNEWVTQVDGE